MTPRLPITLDRMSGVPLYRQVEAKLREAIEADRLRPGRRLPSVRALSAELGIGRLTVATAYEQLAADGYVVGRIGSGTVVAANPPRSTRRAGIGGDGSPVTPRVPGHAAGGPLPGPNRRMRVVRSPGPFRVVDADAVRYDLRPARGAGAGIVPGMVLERLLREAWRDVAEGIGGSRDNDRAGDPRLRGAIAAHLAATRGARCNAGRVIVLSGALLGLAALARVRSTVREADGRIAAAVEDPGDPVLRGALALADVEVIAVPVDRNGLQVAQLPSRADLVLVAPTTHVPTGACLPLARRLGLLAWARECRALVVEDARADELRFGGEAVACLQDLDPAASVVHLGSFESILHDGVRIGYLVVPDELVEPTVATLESVDPGPTRVQQAALARFIEDGHFERHLDRVRRALSARESAARETIGEALGWLATVEPVTGGTRLVVTIEDPAWTATRVARIAARAGVAVELLAPARIATAPDREIVVDFGRLQPGEFRAGVHQLASALRSSAGAASARSRVRVVNGPGAVPAVPAVPAVRFGGWSPSGRTIVVGAGRSEA